MFGPCARLLIAVTALFAAAVPPAGAADVGAGSRQQDVVDEAYPYAAIAPRSTNTNLEMFVVGCEEVPDGRVIQIQLYTDDGSPLQPTYFHLLPLKGDARVAIVIDRRVYPVFMLAADDYSVLADTLDGFFPTLSRGLLDAMQTGSEMTLYFDLVEERPGEPARFDSEAVIDLQAPHGREAIASLRRCAEPPMRAQAQAQSPRE